MKRTILVAAAALILFACAGQKLEVQKKDQQELPGGFFAGPLKWVPGKYLLAGITEDTGEVITLDASAGKLERLFKLPDVKSVSDKFQKLCITPDGQKFIFREGDRTFSYELSSKKRSELKLGMMPQYIAAAPDNRYIAFSAQKGIFIAGVDGAGVRQLSKHRSQYLQWSPDGKTLGFVASPGKTLRTVNADGSGDAELLTGAEGFLWFPDGARMAAVKALEAGILDVKTKSYEKFCDFTTLPNPTQVSFSTWISLSPDGKRIAYNFGTLKASKEKDEEGKEKEVYDQVDSDIHIYDTGSKRTVNITGTPDKWELYPEYSWDGNYIFGYNRKTMNGKVILTPFLIDVRF